MSVKRLMMLFRVDRRRIDNGQEERFDNVRILIAEGYSFDIEIIEVDQSKLVSMYVRDTENEQIGYSPNRSSKIPHFKIFSLNPA